MISYHKRNGFVKFFRCNSFFLYFLCISPVDILTSHLYNFHNFKAIREIGKRSGIRIPLRLSVVCLAAFGRASFFGGHQMILLDKVKGTHVGSSRFCIETDNSYFSRYNSETLFVLPGFAMCMSTFANRVFLIKRRSEPGHSPQRAADIPLSVQCRT